MRPVHVLFVDSWRGWGGGQRWAMQLVEGLPAHGIQVTVAAADPQLREAAARAGARVLALPLALRASSPLRSAALLASRPLLVLRSRWLLRRAGDVDTVHLAGYEDQLFTTKAFRRAGRSVTWSVHGRLGGDPGARAWARLRGGARRTSGILAVSSDVRDSLAERGVDPSRVTVIGHGIEREWLVTSPRPASAGPPVVGYLGRLVAEKDPLLFIEVAEVARHRGLQARWRLYGDGPLAAACRERVRALGLEQEVELMGHVPDARAAYDELDLLVLTSRTEGFGLVLLEAAARGVPAVAVDLPAVRDVVLDGETGLVCERSAEALATAAVRLAGEPALRERLGAAARERAGREFGVERMLEHVAALLRGSAS